MTDNNDEVNDLGNGDNAANNNDQGEGDNPGAYPLPQINPDFFVRPPLEEGTEDAVMQGIVRKFVETEVWTPLLFAAVPSKRWEEEGGHQHKHGSHARRHHSLIMLAKMIKHNLDMRELQRRGNVNE